MKPCAYCGIEHTTDELRDHGTYCSFCHGRLIRQQRSYRRYGLIPPSIKQLHRARYTWRQSYELDQMYPPLRTWELEAAA